MCKAAAYGTGFARLIARRNEFFVACEGETYEIHVFVEPVAKPVTNISFPAPTKTKAELEAETMTQQAARAQVTLKQQSVAQQPAKAAELEPQSQSEELQQASQSELHALLRQEPQGLQIGRPKGEDKSGSKSYNQLQAFKTAAQKFRAIGGVDVLTIRTIITMASCGYNHQAIGRGRLLFTNQSPDTNRGPLHVVLTLNPIADSLTEIGLTSAYQTTGPLAGEIVKRHLSKLRQRLEMSIAGSRAA